MQDGTAAALSGAGGPKAYSAVPQGSTPPYYVVADMDADAEGAKGDGQFERLSIEVHTVTRASERGSLLAHMHKARTTLDGRAIVHAGAGFEPLRFLRASVSRAGPDGVTYLGISLFARVALTAGRRT